MGKTVNENLQTLFLMRSSVWSKAFQAVNSRSKGDGILLVEPKRVLNDEEGNAQAKSQINHPEYRAVMMLYWEREERWFSVEYESAQDKNRLDRLWVPELMVGY
jgi:type III restriction enzyme